MADELTQEDCKRLTEFLGECWHNAVCVTELPHPLFVCKGCGKEGRSQNFFMNRTFTTSADQHAVFTKLGEVGKVLQRH